MMKKFVDRLRANVVKKPTGEKFDGGKLRWSLLPAGFVNEVLRVLEYGAQKYQVDNWQLVPDGRRRYYDALMRHIGLWWGGEKVDLESGCLHLAHAAASIGFLVWFDAQSNRKRMETEDEARRSQQLLQPLHSEEVPARTLPPRRKRRVPQVRVRRKRRSR